MPSLRVLIIEPTRVLGQLALHVVDEVGGSSTLVTSADEGLRRLQREEFDVVCCAAVLRGLSSFEFARLLRARKPTLPLVLLTTGQDEAFCHAALAAGVTQVVPRADLHALTAYLTIAAQRAAENDLSGHVLLVEDSPSLAFLIARTLEEAGLKVTTHSNVEGALKSFVAESFDLVVTDIVLSGTGSGITLVRDLRHSFGKRGERTPILAVTSLDDPARRVELIRSGVNDFMLKPFLPEELVARVSKLLQGKRLLERFESQQEALRVMALTDQLTQLPNRRHLVDAAVGVIEEARLSGQPISLIVVDIDSFKSINDRHGHSTGDVVLSEVAGLLRAEKGARDIVARFGGEEFVVLLPQCPLEAAVDKAEQLRKRIEQHAPLGIAVTASLGVSCSSLQGGADFEQLFTRADNALYTAKRSGRNRVVSEHS